MSQLQFVNMFHASYFFLVIDWPTRITDKPATLIDNIFNSFNFETISGIIYTDITDHLPIFYMMQCNDTIKSNVWNFSEQNKMKFKNILAKMSFEEIYNKEDPNSAYSTLIDLVNSCLINAFLYNIILPKRRGRNAILGLHQA